LQERALAGSVRADDGQRLAVDQLDRDVPECPELLHRMPGQELPDRLPDGLLLVEPQRVLDADVLGPDRVRRSRMHARRCCERRHRTFAKFGSSRLKMIVAIAIRRMLTARRMPSDSQFGISGPLPGVVAVAS